jgi:hypothetical protein
VRPLLLEIFKLFAILSACPDFFTPEQCPRYILYNLRRYQMWYKGSDEKKNLRLHLDSKCGSTVVQAIA